MSDTSAKCELTTDDAKKAVKEGDLTPEDRTLSLQVIDLMHRSGLNLANRLTGEPVCQSEKQILGRARLEGISKEGQIQLEKILLPGKTSMPADKPSVIVYDELGFHADVVAGVMKSRVGKDNLPDEKMMFVSPHMADAPKKTNWYMPVTIDEVSTQDKNELKALPTIVERITSDFAKLLPEIRKNPGVVINMSMELFDLALKDVGAKSYTPDLKLKSISPAELQMNKVEGLGQINSEFLTSLESHLLARSNSDVRAAMTMKIVGALRELATAGAEVKIAWGNADVLPVNKLLAQIHPNIEAVSSIDTRGRNAAYNRDTADFAKSKKAGTALLVSADQFDNIDSKSLPPNVTLVEKPESDYNSFSGDKLSDRWMKSSTFKQLKTMQPLAESITMMQARMLYLKAGIQGGRMVTDESAKSIYDELSQINKEGTQSAFGSKSDFMSKLMPLRNADITQMSDLEMKQHFEKQKDLIDKINEIFYQNIKGEMSKLGYPKSEGLSPEASMKEFTDAWQKLADSGVLNKRELRELYGDSAKEYLSSDSLQTAYLFKLNGPILGLYPPIGYVKVNDKHGEARLAEEVIGTSIAAPVASAEAIKAKLISAR